MLENSFSTLFLTAEAYLAHPLSAVFLGNLEFHRGFIRLRLEIEFSLSFTGFRKVLGEMPALM